MATWLTPSKNPGDQGRVSSDCQHFTCVVIHHGWECCLCHYWERTTESLHLISPRLHSPYVLFPFAYFNLSFYHNYGIMALLNPVGPLKESWSLRKLLGTFDTRSECNCMIENFNSHQSPHVSGLENVAVYNPFQRIVGAPGWLSR